MKKLLYVLSSLAYLLLLGVFVNRLLFFTTAKGWYFSPTDTLYCRTNDACIHELGHRSDASLGWASKTIEYEIALYELSKTNHPWAEPLKPLLNRRTQYREVYAMMLESAYGEKTYMPEIMQPFYNWKLIEVQIQENGWTNDYS